MWGDLSWNTWSLWSARNSWSSLTLQSIHGMGAPQDRQMYLLYKAMLSMRFIQSSSSVKDWNTGRACDTRTSLIYNGVDMWWTVKWRCVPNATHRSMFALTSTRFLNMPMRITITSVSDYLTWMEVQLCCRACCTCTTSLASASFWWHDLRL